MSTEKNDGISRRDSLKYIALGSIATGYLASCTSPEEVDQQISEVEKKYPGLSERDIQLLKEEYFTVEERETVRQLGNLIIPKDDRSGNAEEAGVPKFIEFIMLDSPDNQPKMSGGLKWLDIESLKRFQSEFRNLNEDQQRNILDDIAYPDKAEPQFSHGVIFFNYFRDLVSTGFWSSPMGVKDIGYMGNVANVWQGAPKEYLDKLGVSYDS